MDYYQIFNSFLAMYQVRPTCFTALFAPADRAPLLDSQLGELDGADSSVTPTSRH